MVESVRKAPQQRDTIAIKIILHYMMFEYIAYFFLSGPIFVWSQAVTRERQIVANIPVKCGSGWSKNRWALWKTNKDYKPYHTYTN